MSALASLKYSATPPTPSTKAVASSVNLLANMMVMVHRLSDHCSAGVGIGPPSASAQVRPLPRTLPATGSGAGVLSALRGDTYHRNCATNMSRSARRAAERKRRQQEQVAQAERNRVARLQEAERTTARALKTAELKRQLVELCQTLPAQVQEVVGLVHLPSDNFAPLQL